jgi:hypothetical protein
LTSPRFASPLQTCQDKKRCKTEEQNIVVKIKPYKHLINYLVHERRNKRCIDVVGGADKLAQARGEISRE